MEQRALALMEHNEYSAPGKSLYIQRTIASQASTLNLLFQAISQASMHSIGRATNPYLAITVMDETNPAGRPHDELMKEWNEYTENFIPPEIWPTTCIDYLHYHSFLKITSPRFSAPYTIYPLPADYVAGLATGYLMVHYRLNTAAITQALQEAGFAAVCLLGAWRTQGGEPPKKPISPLFVVRKGTWILPISEISIEQVLCDGLPLEDLVASLEELYQSRALSATTREKHERFWVAFTYTGLENTWRSSLNYVAATEGGEGEKVVRPEQD